MRPWVGGMLGRQSNRDTSIDGSDFQLLVPPSLLQNRPLCSDFLGVSFGGVIDAAAAKLGRCGRGKAG